MIAFPSQISMLLFFYSQGFNYATEFNCATTVIYVISTKKFNFSFFSMAKLQPAMDPKRLYSNMVSNGFSDRDTRQFLRIPEFMQLKYKSHQVCFFHQYFVCELQKSISYSTIGSIFEINKSTVSRNIRMNYQEQKI